MQKISNKTKLNISPHF